MTIRGRVQNGVVVPDKPGTLPEGAAVSVAIINEATSTAKRPADHPRQGGVWKGQVAIADDFDELPDDLAEAFGVREP